MRISLVSLICLLTTWHALAAVNANTDGAIVRRQHNLRKLQSDFDATQAPGGDDNEDDEDFDTVLFQPPVGNNTEPEGAASGGDEEGGDDVELGGDGEQENLGDEGNGEDTPAESPVEAGGDEGGDEEGDPTGAEEGAGGDDVTETPVEAPSETAETPTEGAGGGDETPTEEAPSAAGGDETGGEDVPSATGDAGGDDTFAPVATPTEDIFPTEPAESPTEERFPTPTAAQPTFDDEPTGPSFSPPTAPTPTFSPPTAPTPTFSTPTAPFPTPTSPQPTPKPYVPNDEDDPIMGPSAGGEPGGSGTSNNDDWGWNNSSVEELEHDQTVIIALSVVFGVMFLFSVFVAYQMLENPHGCCASICRITVACFCGILRFFCYPCRAICGCTGNQNSRDHMIVPDDHGNYTHDLELS